MRPNPEFLDVVQANFPAGDAAASSAAGWAGARSRRASSSPSAGFTNVANVLGGFGGAPQMAITGWVQAGLPVETARRPAATTRAARRRPRESADA